MVWPIMSDIAIFQQPAPEPLGNSMGFVDLPSHRGYHCTIPRPRHVRWSQRINLCLCARRLAYGIVVRALAAWTAQAFVARVPVEPLPFRAAIPTLGLSLRSRDRPRRVAEMFFAG